MRKPKAPARDATGRLVGDEAARRSDVDALIRAERAHAHSLDLLGLMLLCQRESPLTPDSWLP
ncbi:MAG TPA: hypothetical protein VGJ91_02535 [Polyangiaceae bacterium]